MTNAALTVIEVALGLGGLVALGRAVRGPTLADRIIALDVILLLLAGGIAVESARTGSELFTGVLVVVALVAFIGTVLVARFIEWRDTE
jgi:multicomponent Na+:H+ antiporter subunit F